jgi:precorrin-6Y C5,15-methyltransferase (decarboxylating)
MITLIGMGSGTPESLTAQGLAALQNAGLILGAKRLLEQLPQGCTEHRKALYQPEDVLAALAADPEVDAALVYSGDTGFYSGAAQLLPMLRAFGISCRVLPGLSSVQLLAAAVGRSWQEWKLVSAHGCACDPVAECLTAGGKPVFFLTGGAETPASLCGRLAAAGLGDAHVLVGEELGRAEEKILFGTAQEFAQKQFASLSVLLVEHLPQPPRRVPGFPDEAFHRGEVPMTKQEVRAAALAKLAVQPADTLWDVGAGTGSVSVELALAAPRGHVYAVECDPEACGHERLQVLHLYHHREGAGGPARPGCRVHRRDQGGDGGCGGHGACPESERPHLHLCHCAGNAERRRSRTDCPRPCYGGNAGRGQPHPACGQAPPADGQ